VARRRGNKGCGRRREIVVPSEDQVLAAVAAAAPDAFRVFCLTAAFSGLRLFEVAALQVGDVDPDGGVVLVRRGKGGYRRESLLFEPACSALAAWVGQGWPDHRLVFRTALGTPFTRQYVAKRWGVVRGELGLGCTFHGLRHFHACWLLDKGASDADVAAQLGHHDHGQLVKTVYGAQRSREAALRRLDELR
jgi:integrase